MTGTSPAQSMVPAQSSDLEEIRARIAALPLEIKCALLTGIDGEKTAPCPELGLRAMVMSEGPVGIHGPAPAPGRPHPLLTPSPSALAATWDDDLAEEAGTLLGAQARDRNVDILLAPAINMHRSPLAGRHFECFSEDPLLTARLAVAFVLGVQSTGVAATAKHYVGSEVETERTSYDSVIDERALREVYLAPFEASVEAGVWAVMAAQNKINGLPMTESTALLQGVLKDEWEFDGVVLSDWVPTLDAETATLAGLDLTMSWPGGPRGEALVAAVQDGRVPEWVINDKVERLLRLAARVGALGSLPPSDGADGDGDGETPEGEAVDDVRPATDGTDDEPAANSGEDSAQDADLEDSDPAEDTEAETETEAAAAAGSGAEAAVGAETEARAATLPTLTPADARQRLRLLAGRACVLLTNDGILPLATDSLHRLALIGPNATDLMAQGGGTARVNAAHVVSVEEGLRHALTSATELTVDQGVSVATYLKPVSADLSTDPVTEEPGARLSLLGRLGASAAASTVQTSRFVFNGKALGVPLSDIGEFIFAATICSPVGGLHQVEVTGVGRFRVTLDRVDVAEDELLGSSDVLEQLTRPPLHRSIIDLEAGKPHHLRVRFTNGSAAPVITFGVGLEPMEPSDDERIAAAVAAAAAAPVAVVVVGTTPEVESQGYDRTTMALPGRQDDLVRAVAAVNPRTIVVVNAGSPVLMPWVDDVAAVLWAWLPGQEGGEAIADVLTGAAEPGGRLPTTMPATQADSLAAQGSPVDGTVEYTESVDAGYRRYVRNRMQPAFSFGHGLTYTTWTYGEVSAALREDGGIDVEVDVLNDGSRPGREIVQCYLEPADGSAPLRLVGWAHVEADAGKEVRAYIDVPPRATATWDAEAVVWTAPVGTQRVRVGRSVGDLRGAAEFSLD